MNRSENTGNSTMPRNDGYARSRGAFVTFLDDDDWYFPDHVAANVEALERTGAACAYSNFLVRLVRREADGTETELGWDLERNPGITSFELLVANRIGYMTVFCRRSAIETVGPFDPEGLGGEEVEMWLRLAQRFDYVHLDRPTTAYTIRTNWSGQATAQNHHLFAGGYEYVYRRYAAAGLPHILAARERYLDASALVRHTGPTPAALPDAGASSDNASTDRLKQAVSNGRGSRVRPSSATIEKHRLRRAAAEQPDTVSTASAAENDAKTAETCACNTAASSGRRCRPDRGSRMAGSRPDGRRAR